MKVFFIRHAPTAMNLTGEMALNYENATIIGDDKEEWFKKMGDLIPPLDFNVPICSSPAVRCRQTCHMLFNRNPDMVLEELHEFNCKDLGDMKFWEVTQEEFENRVKIRSFDMERQVDILFKMFDSFDSVFKNINNIICISHGMVIRYIYHYLNNNKGITPYEIINSKGFTFANLDLLVYDTIENTILVRNYKDPIKHG